MFKPLRHMLAGMAAALASQIMGPAAIAEERTLCDTPSEFWDAHRDRFKGTYSNVFWPTAVQSQDCQPALRIDGVDVARAMTTLVAARGCGADSAVYTAAQKEFHDRYPQKQYFKGRRDIATFVQKGFACDSALVHWLALDGSLLGFQKITYWEGI